MASSQALRREGEKSVSDKMKMSSQSIFDPNLKCISGVQGVVTYTDSSSRRFGLAWSLSTGRLFISAYLLNKPEFKTLKEGDWIEATVVWMHDNWVVRTFFRTAPLVETKALHVGHNVFLEVNTTVVVGAVRAIYAICYSELFGRVVVYRDLQSDARVAVDRQLEWGAMFRMTLSKPRDPDVFGCEWTVTKVISKCNVQRPLPLTIRFVHATVGESVANTSYAMVTDDGDNLIFESFAFVQVASGSTKVPKKGDRVEAYVCRDTGDKMRVVGVRLMKKQTSTAPLSTRSATTVNHTDEDTAQLLDDLEEICSDCSVDEDASSDERVEPEPPRSSGSATSQQNPRPNPKSLRAESSIGSVNEVNSQMTAWRGIGESQREESPCAVGAESEPRPTSTPQMSAFGSSDGSEECRAKELLKRIMDCKGVIELIATEDALLMRDIYFFDRCQ